MESLSGHAAIISGALGDIGRAIALELAARGADIALGDIVDKSKAAPLLGELKRLGVAARYDRVDVSDAKAVQRWIDAASREMGVLDIVIPNAAIVTPKDARTVTPQEFSRELRINLDGAFFMAQAGALALAKKKRPGRIVFVGSWAGHAPHAHIPAYCVAKAGLRMACQCLALEFAPDGILVNEIAPGYVDAGLSGKFFKRNPKLRETAKRKVPVRKLISAEEVARCAASLCDFNSVHVTGNVLVMDGGLSLKRG
jgi:glucose 1-dehydrogenase